VREFQSAGGRRWSASLFYIPSSPSALVGHDAVIASTSVLRFRSEDVTLDLADWPDDWMTLPDEGLLSLLRRATIPRFLPLRSRYDRPSYERYPISPPASR
jgi:hypothetical protein